MPLTNTSTNTTTSTSPDGTTMPRHNTLRQTDFLPTRYTGDRLNRDDSTAHFLTFEDYLDAHDIDATDTDQFPIILKTFRRTLQGQARLWIDGLQFSTYDDLKDAFVRRFSPAKSSYSHVRDFNTMTMTDGESAEAYLQRLRLTATYIDYGETQIRHRLLDSLPDDCRAAILMSASATVLTSDEIAAKAQLFLDLRHDSNKPTKELTFSAQAEIDNLRDQITSLKVTNSQDNDKDRGRTRHRRPSTPTRTSRSASNDHDHQSHRSDRNHDRNRDPSLNRRGMSPHRRDNSYTGQRPRPRLTCDYCHIPGHVWRHCRRRLNDAEQQQQQQYRQQQQHPYQQNNNYRPPQQQQQHPYQQSNNYRPPQRQQQYQQRTHGQPPQNF